MMQLIEKGGPIMWPLLLTSLITLSLVMERVLFIFKIKIEERDNVSNEIISSVKNGKVEDAIALGEKSKNYIARTMAHGLKFRQNSFTEALLQHANQELRFFSRGLLALDTIITLAPLLGLFGTVTGMIRAFGLLGGAELGAPAAITGGIAEALIATAFGLVIAIVALIPYNYLTNRLELARHQIEDASTSLEFALNETAKGGASL